MERLLALGNSLDCDEVGIRATKHARQSFPSRRISGSNVESIHTRSRDAQTLCIKTASKRGEDYQAAKKRTPNHDRFAEQSRHLHHRPFSWRTVRDA